MPQIIIDLSKNLLLTIYFGPSGSWVFKHLIFGFLTLEIV